MGKGAGYCGSDDCRLAADDYLPYTSPHVEASHLSGMVIVFACLAGGPSLTPEIGGARGGGLRSVPS